jgi:hypothetical protein
MIVGETALDREGNPIGELQTRRGVRVWRLFLRGGRSFTTTLSEWRGATDVLDYVRTNMYADCYAVEPVT